MLLGASGKPSITPAQLRLLHLLEYHVGGDQTVCHEDDACHDIPPYYLCRRLLCFQSQTQRIMIGLVRINELGGLSMIVERLRPQREHFPSSRDVAHVCRQLPTRNAF